MPVQWKGTKYKGVRYYEHPTRKHGVAKDKYFAIRYQRDGKRTEEGLGWGSELDPKDQKHWTAEKAALILADLKEVAKGLKQGPSRLSERRQIENKRKEAIKGEEERIAKENITLKQYFENTYYPDAKINKKKDSYSHEETHFRLWIEPVAGKKPIKDLSEFDARRIVKSILDTGKKPRTAQYVMATLRQIWTKARRGKLVSGDSPTRNVKIPKFDNRRQRFLNQDEAILLLDALKAKDETLYGMALLSLHTGMRASEIFNLTWACIDTERGIITILDAKSGHGRPTFMTDQIKKLFNAMNRRKNDDYVFLQRKGTPYKEIPTLFRDIVTDLKFNDNVRDTRQRVCFHTLRHTMASWHAERGTDLYVLKELLGHGSITLTERYSHLSNGALQEATRGFGKTVKAASKKARRVLKFKKMEKADKTTRRLS